MEINVFIEELKKINIELTKEQLDRLEKYYSLLIEENEKINLTSITEKKEVYLKHFYDSLTLVKIIDLNSIETLCDIGTGAGFPGMIIKIIFPNIKVILVDSLNKRIQFLNKIIEKLNLKEIETFHARIEEFGIINREKYDVVTARAVSNLNTLLEYAIPMVKVNGYFISMKSNIEEEIKNIDSALNKLNTKIDKIEEFYLPIENSKRTLIRFKKYKNTLKIYPRKYSVIKQKPL